MTTTDASIWWEEYGYLAGKHIEGEWWIVLMRMIYTWRVALCTPDYVGEHYCYEDKELAMAAFEVWDGRNQPVAGWTRHHD